MCIRDRRKIAITAYVHAERLLLVEVENAFDGEVNEKRSRSAWTYAVIAILRRAEMCIRDRPFHCGSECAVLSA